MDRNLTSLMAVFFVAFLVFLSFAFFGNNISRILKAKEDFSPSSTQTLMLAYPLTVKADGVDRSNITVFVRDANTRPVPNKIIKLTTSLGELLPDIVTSDLDGKATTRLTCSSSGIAELHAIIDNTIAVKQQVTVKCQ